MIARGLLLCAALAGAGSAVAAEGAAVVMTNQLAPVAGTSAREAIPVEISFRDQQFAIGFAGADRRAYRLVRAVEGAPLVLLDGRGGAMPLPRGRLELFFDPAAPCAAMGMMSDCRSIGEGTYAGRSAVQWRYRHANRKGPGGSEAGTMWLDAETGLVLGYDATTAGGQRLHWQVRQLRYGPQPDESFALPAESSRKR